MEYIVSLVRGDERVILSQHEDKESAMQAGKVAFENAPKGSVVSCILGTINENERLEGQYQLLHTWY